MMLTLAPGWGMSLGSKLEQQVHEQGWGQRSPRQLQDCLAVPSLTVFERKCWYLNLNYVAA